MARRAYLGGDWDGLIRRKIYDVGDALEVDELMMASIERTRVYFDDVLLVTYHRMFGTLYVVTTALGAGFFLGICLLTMAYSNKPSPVPALLGLPFLFFLVLRLIYRVDVVTVFGRRSRARIRFSFQKARAQDLFRDLAGRIRNRQAEVAASIPPSPRTPPLSQEPPPSSPPPPPPIPSPPPLGPEPPENTGGEDV